MQYYDGGAFADCPYIQYPHGMGKQRAPATVLAAAAAAVAAAASTTAGISSSSPSSAVTSSFPVSSSSNPPPSRAVALVSPSSPAQPSHITRRQGETAEETTARTAHSIQASLHAAQQTTEVFDGRSLAMQSRQRSAAAAQKSSTASNALTIVVSDTAAAPGSRESDPGPIVRSPTKEKKSAFTDALLLRPGGGNSTTKDGSGTFSGAGASSTAMTVGDRSSSGSANSSAGSAASTRKVVVPFCVSSWQNRKKLIVPVEQRLAQQHDDRLDADAGMGDAIVDLAMAMQQASKEVAAEMAAKEKARAEEEERRQAALEAAEAEKARQLLEQKAAELAANAQRRETREQRLERIRLERELREQEKLAKQAQRLRERAAARLNITVEDLESDELLLKTVEQASAHLSVSSTAPATGLAPRRTDGSNQPLKLEPQQSSSLPGAPGQAAMGNDSRNNDDADEDDGATGGRRRPAVRGGIFASAVISNEGIQREMEALAAVEAQDRQEQQQATSTMKAPAHDGIRLREEGENSADDDEGEEDGDFQLHNFVPRKRRL
ncbi:hypothetical protein ABB37_08771 [Leptomonas pyrrhocoris]|uniref:SKI-interacting protein SKIP SNW domain-containing protein n=1 Tax=Leptomonas pyrrhocoris TaxID=157538 RepID=A0A0M9FSI7_LEPPY|nr:hypothetical protein ABB37_08771 [Leptomonas pyrrhocoris]KPA75097.1 hypothetical protein ABB37_08771 [Leptomonas pyrrhocoris]|eukprot:XP_015653536.1 hypothetical protein ABB37_08771 [Leptomonas pyrrhocoris]